MKTLILSLALLLFATGCSSFIVGHVHVDGDVSAHFDGRFFAASGTGELEVGFTDKTGIPIYPPTGLVKLDGTFEYALDLKERKEIPFANAVKLLGIADDHDAAPDP